MNTLKVSEFRTKLRECLDSAQEGRAVEVEREGTIFILSLKGKEHKVPWLDLERRIDELKLLLEDMGTPTPKNPEIVSPAANLEKLKKQTGMITAEELNYEPIE